MARDSLSLSEARRIALAAQGFDRPRPRGTVTANHLRRTIRQLGLLQIDSVNIVAPAHYQVLFSRLGPYRATLLDDLVYRRREFVEQWAHEASILPVESWPLLRHRTDASERRLRALAAFMLKHADYVAGVLEEVRARGPLTASEVREPDGSKGKAGEWWGWTTSKAALEGLFIRGAVAVCARRSAGFARVYDLAERVLPPEHHQRQVERAVSQRELIRRSARAIGVGTINDLADYYRIPIREARLRVAELADAGELLEVRVEGWPGVAYLDPGVRIPRRLTAAAVLSPFDPVVWFRPRTSRLFGFDYRIEIYTPKAKRRYGYYVFPFLLNERLVGRVDLKADRTGSRLLVLAAHREPGTDAGEVAEAMAGEMRAMATWLGLDDVVVGRKGDLARHLSAAVKQRSFTAEI